MKNRILALGLIFAFIVVCFTPIPVKANVTEAQITIYGTVKKDIENLSNIFEYKDDEGNLATLGYEVYNNLTIDLQKIQLERQFENASVSGVFLGATELDKTVELLQDANGIRYLLLKGKNNTALTAETWYTVSLTDTVDKQIDNDYYVIVSAIPTALSGSNSLEILRASVEFRIYDSYLNKYQIKIEFDPDYSNMQIMTVIPRPGYDYAVSVFLNSSKFRVFQMKIQDILDAVSSGTKLSKLFEVYYYVTAYTATTISDSSIEFAGEFRYAILSEKLFTINGYVVNGTTLSIPATKTLTSTLNITKIADVQIPFEWIPEPEKYFDVDDYIASYEWRPILPDDSELSFSNVALNFTKPKGKVLELYVNAQDYLDKIASAENGTDVTLLSSISAGTQYFIDCKVQYDCDDFLEIAEKEPSPSFWQAPLAWLAYKFWGVVLVIFNAIGLTGAVIYAKKQKAKSKLKNKLKDLK